MNNNKSVEFQLMKGVAIIGLPIVHISEYIDEQLSSFVTEAHQLFIFLTVLLSIGGPVLFTMCMGYGIANSKKSSLKYFNLGVQFILLGAILNIVRWILPAILKFATSTINYADFIKELYMFFKSDIYYFVGLFFIVYAILRYFHINTIEMIIIGIATLIIGNAISPYIIIENPLLNNLAGNLIYLNKNSCFPLSAWFIFPCVGILMGERFKALDENEYDKTLKRLGCISAVIIIAFIIILQSNIFPLIVGAFNQYFINEISVILLVCITIMWLCLARFICKRWLNTKTVKTILTVSVHISLYYMLQWVFIAWLFSLFKIFNIEINSIFLHILITVIIMTLCIIICKKWGYKLTKILMKLTYVKPVSINLQPNNKHY